MSDDDRNEQIEVYVDRLIRQTDKAGLFLIEGDEHWLPWSQVDSEDVESNGDSGTIYIPRWLAEEKGLD